MRGTGRVSWASVSAAAILGFRPAVAVALNMCGFVGLFPMREDRERLFITINRALSTIKHRGPDGEGVWIGTAGEVGLGHRRLAILDLSTRAAQPMESPDGRYVLVYNGEVYNYRLLRTHLGKEGYPFEFSSNSDTEVVLAALSWWGIREALKRLRGMFALCLWDRENGQMILARDTVGIKPLYYGMTSFGFAAASEAKAFRELPGFDVPVDRKAVKQYLYHGYIPAPFSVFQGVRKLAPGTLLTVGSSALNGPMPEPEPFLTIDGIIEDAQNDPFQGSFSEAVDRVSVAVGNAVSQQLVSDVPLGLLLSGGVDSTLVASEMAAIGGHSKHSFTIGFPGWDTGDEAVFAQRIAGHLGLNHTELEVSPEVALGVVQDLPTIYDEPLADPSALPTLIVCRLARQEVTVALSGDGGDELFFGYRRYLDVVNRLHQLRALARFGGDVLSRVLGLAARAYGHIAVPFLEKVRKRSWDVEGAVRTLVDPTIATVYSRATRICLPEAWLDGVDYDVEESAADLDVQALSDGRWMMRQDLNGYLPDDILVKVDRASMSVGLEVRPPLLDIDLVRLSWSLPEAYLCDEMGGKRVFREVLYERMPRELVDRPKRGFGPPIGMWMRGELRGWMEEALSEKNLQNEALFNVRTVRRRWQAHVQGSADWSYQLWAVAMLQEWLRLN